MSVSLLGARKFDVIWREYTGLKRRQMIENGVASQLPLSMSSVVVRGEQMMLRITTYNELKATKFVIEGKLVGPWVTELQRCWEAAASAQPCKSILLDLTEVTFIDVEGRELLAAMRESGARLIASGLMTQMIDEAIDAVCKKKAN